MRRKYSICLVNVYGGYQDVVKHDGDEIPSMISDHTADDHLSVLSKSSGMHQKICGEIQATSRISDSFRQ